MSALSLFIRRGRLLLFVCCFIQRVQLFPICHTVFVYDLTFFFSPSNCDLPHCFLLTFLSCLFFVFLHLSFELRAGWCPGWKAFRFLVCTTITLLCHHEEEPTWGLSFHICFQDCGGLEVKQINKSSFHLLFYHTFWKTKILLRNLWRDHAVLTGSIFPNFGQSYPGF